MYSLAWDTVDVKMQLKARMVVCMQLVYCVTVSWEKISQHVAVHKSVLHDKFTSGSMYVSMITCSFTVTMFSLIFTWVQVQVI